MHPTTFIATAEAAADVARAVIRPFFRQNLTTDTKDDRSPVTIADRSAEQAMRAVLAQRFPDHGIMGEEFGLDRPGARYRWVLDPIDQPISGERWLGATGQPTTLNGAPIRTRACPALDQAELSCTAPEIFSEAEMQHWRRLQAATSRTSWGGDCYAYGLLAAGHIDVIAEAGLKVWDWAALVPIIQGAGGTITDWSGNPLTAQSDGTVLAVGNPALRIDALKALSRWRERAG
jgi:myo-inositol-1(or 4)-monophosphatase